MVHIYTVGCKLRARRNFNNILSASCIQTFASTCQWPQQHTQLAAPMLYIGPSPRCDPAPRRGRDRAAFGAHPNLVLLAMSQDAQTQVVDAVPVEEGSGQQRATLGDGLAPTAPGEDAILHQSLVASALKSSLRRTGSAEELEMPEGALASRAVYDHVCTLCLQPCEAARCKACNSSRVALSRMYGSWPTAEFKGLKQAEKTLFYENAKGKIPTELKKLAEHALVTFHTSEMENEVGGAYQPLSYWASQGYDTALIQEKCSDTRTHAVFGLTYNLNIHSRKNKDTDGTTRLETRKASRDATSDASSSSSSPSAPKRSKKNKGAAPKKKASKGKRKGNKGKAASKKKSRK